jgi:hypothetical protein
MTGWIKMPPKEAVEKAEREYRNKVIEEQLKQEAEDAAREAAITELIELLPFLRKLCGQDTPAVDEE